MIQDLFIIKRIKEGDIATFEALFKSVYTPLLLYSAGITGRRDVSEEIVQDLFYYIWKERDGLQIMHSIKGYLYKSVRNRSLQYLEHEKVTERFILRNETGRYDSQPTGQDVLEFRELEEILKKSMTKMPERRVEIFRMHRFENKKYTEIAEALSLSVKTIEAEITKALKTIRKEIELHTEIL
ncbi:MAG: RNA polymerase sigma-70 factor [Bacteroidales bacterium]|nr:RNA polymerase sigma-70 factor [Bacteroidales bacterium]